MDNCETEVDRQSTDLLAQEQCSDDNISQEEALVSSVQELADVEIDDIQVNDTALYEDICHKLSESDESRPTLECDSLENSSATYVAIKNISTDEVGKEIQLQSEEEQTVALCDQPTMESKTATDSDDEIPELLEVSNEKADNGVENPMPIFKTELTAVTEIELDTQAYSVPLVTISQTPSYSTEPRDTADELHISANILFNPSLVADGVSSHTVLHTNGGVHSAVEHIDGGKYCTMDGDSLEVNNSTSSLDVVVDGLPEIDSDIQSIVYDHASAGLTTSEGDASSIGCDGSDSAEKVDQTVQTDNDALCAILEVVKSSEDADVIVESPSEGYRPPPPPPFTEGLGLRNDRRRLSTSRLKRSPFLASLRCKKTSEVALLVEAHLKEIYVPFDTVQSQLVRQSRDILLCRYQGNFQKFRECFLSPVASLLKLLKSKYREPVCFCGKSRNTLPAVDTPPTCEFCIGWPLCFNKRLVVNLGELDESLLKPGDFYVCVRVSERETPSSSSSFGTSLPILSLNGLSTLSLGHDPAFQSDVSCAPIPTDSKNESVTSVFDPGGKSSEGNNSIEPPEEVQSSGIHDHPPCCETTVHMSIRYRLKVPEEKNQVVRERRIHENDLGTLFTTMDWLESTESGTMISDDHLTAVLQDLLLSVEKGIERLEWAGVSKPWPFLGNQTSSRCCHGTPSTKDSSVQTNSEEVLTEQSTNVNSGSMNGMDAVQESECSDFDVPANGITNVVQSVTNDIETKRVQPPPADVIMDRLSHDGSLSPVEDDQDDGYCEHTLTQPTTLSQIDDQLLSSEFAILPGCRDLKDRAVVVISSSAIKENESISACHLAQLLLYFHTIPKKEVSSQGFLIVVDALDATEEFWTILDEAFYLLEGNVPNVVSQVLLLLPEPRDISEIFPTSRIQSEVTSSKDKILSYVKKDQLLVRYGGSYVYNHKEWISFRKFLEPFVTGCRLSGKRLVSLLEELRGSRLPPSSALTHQMIEQQKKSFCQAFQDEQLRHLEEEGDAIFQELKSYGTSSPHNSDYRENLERTEVLYDELRKAMCKLSKLADKRLHRLEQCLQIRTFQEESSQVLSWLCRKGTESLEKHQCAGDSLYAIKEQEEEFEKFYFLAMRQIERGNDLLEEVSMLGHEPSLPKIREEIQHQISIAEDDGLQELADSLKQHLGSFSEKLEGTRERIEDTAKCYQLMDKSYEWALEAMRFVSQMGLENTGTVEGVAQQIRCLQEYLDEHVPASDCIFQEILDLSEKLDNEKLTDQFGVAKTRCQESVELIQSRLKTLQKVKQQMEVDSFRGPLWCDGDIIPTPRTCRSHSQPSNIWIPPSSSTPYSLCLGHHRRRSDSSTMSSIATSYSSPIGSYTSFPSSCYPTVKDTYPLDSLIQEEQLLQRGLITEDLTCQGPVTSISRGVLDSRIHRDSSSTTSSSSSSSSSSSCKGPTSVLRSSGRGTYASNGTGGVNIRWSKKHAKKSQMWQLRDEALEKMKNEVREQNALLQTERLHSPQESSNDSIHSSEADISSSSENSCKVPLSHTRSDSLKGPVPVNTHLMNQTLSSDSPDTGGGCEVINDAEAKAKKTLMLIMKEMIQTERDYVKSLDYIIENYIPEVMREDIPQALRGQRNVVFGNIEKIFEFHSQYFLSELEQYEHAPFFAGQCFLKYEPQFYLYALYNKNKPKCDSLMIEYGNAFCRKKQLELQDKMDLASYLLKPVQRMGKYALLLKQLLKECPEREPEHQDLKAAEEMVRFQLRHGNDLLAMDALRDCDVNVKEQGRLLRQDEFLVWQGRSRKSLRHVFLFEDLILFSKARRDPQRKGYEMYQYKNSIKTTDMGLTEQIGDSPSKFEIWFRKRKVNDTYVLQAPNPDVKAAWVHELSKLLWKQALRNREMRLAEMSSMGIGNKPCLDIKPSEDQINDRSISIHQLARAPRFRNSFGMAPYDQKLNKRPHSIISVSSSSSSGSSQSSFTFYGTLNLGFEPGDSPRQLHRSLTQQSQCSTESGFCTDASTAGDSPVDSEHLPHKKAERSDSLLSSDSMSTSTTPSELNCCSPCEEQVIEESITTPL